MRIRAFAAAAVIAAATTGLATGVFAQDRELTEADVQDFLDAMTEESHRIVAGGQWEAIGDWVDRHIAEEAQITASGTLVGSGGPVIRYDMVVNRENLLLFGGMMMAGSHGAGAIEDYALTSSLENVTVLPNGEAVASVRFHESGAVELPAAGGGAETPPALSFHSTADCDLRLRGSGEDVQFTAVTCEVTTTM